MRPRCRPCHWPSIANWRSSSFSLVTRLNTLAFAIKVPLFPLHTWLPDAHVEGAPPAGRSIPGGGPAEVRDLRGSCGSALPHVPVGCRGKAAPFIVILAVIGIVFGALMAYVQNDAEEAGGVLVGVTPGVRRAGDLLDGLSMGMQGAVSPRCWPTGSRRGPFSGV